VTALHSILHNIGNTPLVELRRLDAGRCRLFVKLENQNPTGSIKDRIGLSMVEAAEREGRIQPGGTLIEATAGNTGLGLALVAAQKGYRLLLVMPDKMAQEKVLHLRALGAETIITRSDVGKGHPEYYQDIAERLARETPDSFYVNQFANPANPFAHESTTGPEIWAQMDHMMDAMVVGVGSGGTLTGLSRYFARVAPHVEMVLADPKGSVLVDVVHTGKIQKPAGSWLVEGIGEDFIPDNCDLSRVKSAYEISDAESFHTAREVLHKEGILGGS
jgi:cystathionine beta-synthase